MRALCEMGHHPVVKPLLKQWLVGLGLLLLISCLPWWLRTGTTTDKVFTRINIGLLLVMLLVVGLLGELIVMAVARLVGDRVVATSIGLGPMLRRTFGSLFVQIGLFPLGGSSAIVTTRRNGQVTRFVIARVASATVLLAGVFVLVQRTGMPALRVALETRVAPDVVFALASALVAAVGVGVILTTNQTYLGAWYRLGVAVAASEAFQRGAYADAAAQCRAALASHPDDVPLQITLASALSPCASDEALAILEQVRAREDLTPDQRAIANNNFAWQCYINGRTDLLAVAERASEQAVAQMPSNPHLIGTRGHVALWAKRYTEAEPLIVKAYAGFKHDQHSSRATAAAGLAMLCAATDRPDEAQSWLARARAEGVTHDLVARAIAAVEPLSRR